MIRSYSELSQLTSFDDRFRYLRLNGSVGYETFGVERYLNQVFYTSDEWKSIREKVILRDFGNDLGVEDCEIVGNIIVHHMNPITVDDIVNRSDILLDTEFLISTSLMTHNAIHFGNERTLPTVTVQRSKHDTCPWKK